MELKVVLGIFSPDRCAVPGIWRAKLHANGSVDTTGRCGNNMAKRPILIRTGAMTVLASPRLFYYVFLSVALNEFVCVNLNRPFLSSL